MNTKFKSMSNEDIKASLAKANEEAAVLFALEAPTIKQANEAEALMASIKEHEEALTERAAAAKEAGEKFAAAKAAFTASSEGGEGDDTEDGDDEDDDSDAADAETVEAAAEGDDADDTDGDEDGDDEDGDEDDSDAADAETVEAAKAVKEDEDEDKKSKPKPFSSTAKAVGRKTKRPNVAATQPVTITAAADIPNVAMGSTFSGMDEVAKALMSRAKGFPKFNKRAAERVRSESGGAPVTHKAGLASFGVSFADALTASSTAVDYSAVRNAIKSHEGALSASMEGGNDLAALAAAGGWCAPSTPVYSYIADYVVDGLITVPEVSAPRGGLLLTTGPAKSNDTDGFGFVQTEEQAEAGQEKDLESIVCPEFVDHRLDAIGYGFTIPLLTQKAYPELITDALKFAGALYAHKVNKRIINDIVALSDTVTFEGYGPSLTDSLEVLSMIALRERRKWNIGRNAIMEVKLPLIAQEVFRADMSRRAGLTLDDVASDRKIAAHFSERRLAVEYVSDWQELGGSSQIVLPGSFTALIYPQGTFIKAVEDVVNLSAIYDAASLVVNEYTGVFFEQGILVAKAGYGSSKVSIPINTAGEAGALTLSGIGDAHENGSF